MQLSAFSAYEIKQALIIKKESYFLLGYFLFSFILLQTHRELERNLNTKKLHPMHYVK